MARSKVGHNSRYWKRLGFYVLLLALPLLQFLIFYVYVNAKSIGMAFFTYEANADSLGYTTKFVWFDNFKEVFKLLADRPHLIVNSLRVFFFQTFLALPLALIFSFYVYKKRFASGFFRVVLFLPQIISSTVFAIIFFYFTDQAVPSMISDWFGKETIGILSNTDTQLTTLLIFTVWMSFGVNVLLFTGSMNGINNSLVEAAELDGCNTIHELIHVTIPAIFPTIVSFVIITVSGIFVNQMFLMDFNTIRSDQYTIGYFMYYQAQNANNGLATTKGNLNNGIYSYPVLSALSIMITVVLLPLTLGIKKLLNKFGPSTR